MATDDGFDAGIALHVADVAGVAGALKGALEEHSNWRTESIGLPTHGVGTNRLLHAVGRPARAIRIPKLVRSGIVDSCADVVHVHWARFAPFVIGTGKPTVIHAHGSDVRFRGGATKVLVDQALRQSSAVVVSTPDLLACVPIGASYLPNPIPVDSFMPHLGASPKRRRVLFFARLSAVKGAPVMIDAARAISTRDDRVEMVAIRGGEYDVEAERAGIQLIDPVPRDRIVDLLHSVDVVVGQQRFGILSLSELEAMACGLPVVVPLRPELYPVEVPVASAYSAGELAEAVLGLIAEPAKRTSIGVEARAFVAAHHAPAVVASLLSDLYSKVTSG